MRTIKFRAKASNGEWHYGDLEHSPIGKYCRIHEYWDNGLYKSQYDVEPDTVGQFTGLTDENGKEIYEGDIISSKKHPQIKHLIFYNEKQGKFMAGFNGNTNIYDFGVCGVDIPAWMAEKEVIGNIHDNKSLIEKGGE